jgi:hypothetical protein
VLLGWHNVGVTRRAADIRYVTPGAPGQSHARQRQNEPEKILNFAVMKHDMRGFQNGRVGGRYAQAAAGTRPSEFTHGKRVSPTLKMLPVSQKATGRLKKLRGRWLWLLHIQN